MKNLRAAAVGILVGAVFVGGGAFAYASIPDSSSVIHACYQNVTGPNKPVKLLDTAAKATCPSDWKPVAWNQKGLQGAPGATGPAGALIAARARIESPTTLGPLNDVTPVPLTGGSWTQPANTVEEVVFRATADYAPTCVPPNGGEALSFYVSVDGVQFRVGDFRILQRQGNTGFVSLLADSVLFESGSAAQHTMTVSVARAEFTAGCVGADAPTVTAFSADVINIQ